MAIARVTAQEAKNNSTTTTVVGTYPGTPTQGNLLLAWVSVGGTASHPTCADADGSWTEVEYNQDSTATRSLTLFSKIAVASQPTAITATRASATLMDISIYEYSGTSATPIGVTTETDGTGTSTIGHTGILITDAGSLIVTGVFTSATVTSTSVNSSFTKLFDNPTGAIRLIDAFRVPGSIATYTPIFSWTTSRNWAAISAEFLPAVVAPTSLIWNPHASSLYGR